MGDYNLSGLNPRGFEQLVQALALKVVATGVRPFGDGKDGGRDATFEGRTHYPTEADPWDGYGVIQAKFLQRPFQHKDEGAWALSQMEADLKKFSNPESELRRPKYYIFATNAVFTPAPETGTIDKADALFKEYQEPIGLREFEVWHHDTICRMLDVHGDIRRAYAAFITTGDVLAKVIDALEDRKPDFEVVMADYLQKQLLADQYVKLGQAGYSPTDRTHLSKVFVDLPVSDGPTTEPPRFRPAFRGFVAEILHEAAQLLDNRTIRGSEAPSALEETSSDAGGMQHEPPKTIPPGRRVLVGGPGQGKTTIGQFICQLYRVAILKDRPPQTRSREVEHAMGLIRDRADGESLVIPGVRRYPVRVVLNEFASSLSNGAITSLLTYILADISKVTGRDLTLDDLRAWLAAYPWILILDGLDEVPSSSNRAVMLDRINEFWVDVASLNADLMVIATTRPQGYEKEFSPQVFRHRHLRPLPENYAIHYAGRLIESRHSDDPQHGRQILARLERACREPSTARLMTTPLQITIMALLVERIGEPPSQRWELFKRYFDVIYDRETAKTGPVGGLLKDFKALVAVIHQKVGLRLHLEGEKAGGTEASLSSDDFRSIIEGWLEEVGYEGDELHSLAGRLGAAAMDRLVFLVSPVAERVGFEVRSLQEFMAAEEMASGEEKLVQDRLVAIAGSPYWRNVFLFAAGNWVDRRAQNFNDLIAICSDLNESTGERSATLQGSFLALDLMEEQIARVFPRHSRSLTRVALRLLSIPPAEWADRMASSISPATENVFFEEITDRIGQASVFTQLGAWVLLHRLSEFGNQRAARMCENCFSHDPTAKLEVLRSATRKNIRTVRVESIAEIAPHVTYTQIREAEILGPLAKHEEGRFPDWFSLLTRLLGSRGDLDNWFTEVPVNLTPVGAVSLRFVPVGAGPHRSFADLDQMPPGHPAWTPIIASARFVADPSARTLCEALRATAHVWDNRIYEASVPTGVLPWPLAECVAAGRCAADFLDMANLAEAGHLGDLSQWEEAEVRWKKFGIEASAFEAETDHITPFDLALLQRRLPFRSGGLRRAGPDSPSVDLLDLDRLHQNLPATRARSALAGLILRTLGDEAVNGRTTQSFHVSRLGSLIRDSHPEWVDVVLFARRQPHEVNTEEWADLFDYIGRERQLTGFHYLNSKLPEILTSLRLFYSDRPGLLNMSCRLAVLGYPVRRDEIPDPEEAPAGVRPDLLLIARLVLPGLEEDEAEHLAECARELVAENSILINIIESQVRERQKGNAAASLFLTKLLPNWPKERWLSKGRAIEFIAGGLHAQRSGLAEPEMLRSLGLAGLGLG